MARHHHEVTYTGPFETATLTVALGLGVHWAWWLTCHGYTAGGRGMAPYAKFQIAKFLGALSCRRVADADCPMSRLNGTPWVWVYCANHLCSRARAVTPWAIRWGIDDPSDLIRENFRCVMCGRRGAVLNMPGVEDLIRFWRALLTRVGRGGSPPRFPLMIQPTI
jgi:hypothetical protein